MIESVDTSSFSPFCCHYFLFDVLFKALAAWLDWSSRKMRDEETPLTRTLSILVLDHSLVRRFEGFRAFLL
jgi:hypothetical protein